MKYLLDTHVFLWTLFDTSKLSTDAKEIILDSRNEIYISVITYWEISLKFALGKLELKGATPEALPEIAEDAGYESLGLSVTEVASFHKLLRNLKKTPVYRSFRSQVS